MTVFGSKMKRGVCPDHVHILKQIGMVVQKLLNLNVNRGKLLPFIFILPYVFIPD